MGETAGVLAAMLSSGIGGTAIGATRYLAGATDPLALGFFRFGIGFVLLLPLALWRRERWPGMRDWPAAVALGLLFFGLFPVLFNAALVHTTAARGALALSTLPLLTMLMAALFRVERLTRRKSAGVLVAIGGVAARPAGRPRPCARRRVARRPADGRGRALHGALQRERATLDRTLRAGRVHHLCDGRWRRMPRRWCRHRAGALRRSRCLIPRSGLPSPTSASSAVPSSSSSGPMRWSAPRRRASPSRSR